MPSKFVYTRGGSQVLGVLFPLDCCSGLRLCSNVLQRLEHSTLGTNKKKLAKSEILGTQLLGGLFPFSEISDFSIIQQLLQYLNFEFTKGRWQFRDNRKYGYGTTFFISLPITFKVYGPASDPWPFGYYVESLFRAFPKMSALQQVIIPRLHTKNKSRPKSTPHSTSI